MCFYNLLYFEYVITDISTSFYYVANSVSLSFLSSSFVGHTHTETHTRTHTHRRLSRQYLGQKAEVINIIKGLAQWGPAGACGWHKLPLGGLSFFPTVTYLLLSSLVYFYTTQSTEAQLNNPLPSSPFFLRSSLLHSVSNAAYHLLVAIAGDSGNLRGDYRLLQGCHPVYATTENSV